MPHPPIHSNDQGGRYNECIIDTATNPKKLFTSTITIYNTNIILVTTIERIYFNHKNCMNRRGLNVNTKANNHFMKFFISLNV